MLKEKRRRTETRRIQQSTLSLLMHYSHQTKKFPTRESQQQTLSNYEHIQSNHAQSIDEHIQSNDPESNQLQTKQ